MKAGDKVIVYRRILKHKNGQHSCWIPDMDSTIGKIFIIEKYMDSGMRNPRLSNGFYYPKRSLKYA